VGRVLTRITLNNSTEERFSRRGRTHVRQTAAAVPKFSSLQLAVGGASFQLNIRNAPVVVCFVCWGRRSSETCWALAETVFFSSAEINISMDQGSRAIDPPPTPWLATLLVVPQFDKLPIKKRLLVRTTEIEFAWGLIERNEA